MGKAGLIYNQAGNVKFDLYSRAVRRHRAASPAPEGQQGKEREATGTAETEREHPQESQAVLGQNSCQEQQEHGLQTQVQVLP